MMTPYHYYFNRFCLYSHLTKRINPNHLEASDESVLKLTISAAFDLLNMFSNLCPQGMYRIRYMSGFCPETFAFCSIFVLRCVEAFPAWQLPARVQYTPDGKKRKEAVDLKKCALKEMVQYSCDLHGPRSDPTSKVVCEPIVRLFRQYVYMPRQQQFLLTCAKMCSWADGRDYGGRGTDITSRS